MILFNAVVESGRQMSSLATSAAEIVLFCATVLHFSFLPILLSASHSYSLSQILYAVLVDLLLLGWNTDPK